jgi:hypothetical protein
MNYCITVKATWNDAFAECCSIGMQLAGIETDDEMRSIVAFKNTDSNLISNFWMNQFCKLS